ncbi:RING finger domain-containing protein [Endozoicomonas sp. YOMI1]|uniref:RING finger domain-containing protein n=1 Tax=Endozoicomonas sp. YOMI1 TaxID=2828739 RepID=UPI0021484828|nr:RING finger domain-containing protein [Endozoicomonas sp. YOMI1]
MEKSIAPVTNPAKQAFNDVCPICLVGFFGYMRVMVTPCRHRYHEYCLTPWLDSRQLSGRTCPVCLDCAVPLMREEGARLYEFSAHSESLPLNSCRTGNLAQLQQLLSLDPSIVYDLFRTGDTGHHVRLLYMAASNGHSDCVRALVAAGGWLITWPAMTA